MVVEISLLNLGAPIVLGFKIEKNSSGHLVLNTRKNPLLSRLVSYSKIICDCSQRDELASFKDNTQIYFQSAHEMDYF
jgi:hypothetical protein